jgi:predicted amidohydrolase YtcJ
VHAIGDQANAAVLDAIEDLSQTYKGDRRWRIEHAQIVDPADFARFGRNGIVASMQPVHQTSDRLMAEARLGPQRLRRLCLAFPPGGGCNARLRVGRAGGTGRPFAGIAAAISREDPAGQPVGGWQPQERVDRASALAGYSSGAAWAGFAEQRFGRPAPGQRADFVFVDTDPMFASAAEIRATKVLETWIGGGKVWSADQADASSATESAEPCRTVVDDIP